MRPASPHILARATVVCAVVALMLICAAPAVLGEPGTAQQRSVDVPIWFDTTLTFRFGLPSCRQATGCSSRPATRPGVSIWLTRISTTGQDQPTRNRMSLLTMRQLFAISFD
jgi:hypothetical protein